MTQKDEAKRSYSQIPHKIRLELIQLIQKQNYPISVAGELLRIKLSTAKLIMSKFKSKGYVTKYKRQKTQLKTKRKQKQNNCRQNEQVQQPIENNTKNIPNEKQQSKSAQSDTLQQVITLQNPTLGIVPLYQYRIPVYFTWSFPQ